MKRIFLFLSLCLAFASVGMAQTGSEDENQLSEKVDTITMLKSTFARYYAIDGNVLSMYKLADVLKEGNKKAYRMFLGGYTLYSTSIALAAGGGYFLGYEAVNFVSGKEVHKRVLAFGGACLAASLGINYLASKKINKSVQIYNEGLLNPAPSPSSDDVAINFGITPSGGLGFTLSF